MNRKRDTSRHFFSFPLEEEVRTFKIRMLNWARRSVNFCFLDSNTFTGPHGEYEALLGAGVQSCITASSGGWDALRSHYSECGDWLFGHLCYEFENEQLQAGGRHADGILCPDLFFFQPETVILLKAQEIRIGSGAGEKDARAVLQEIRNAPDGSTELSSGPVAFQHRLSETDYLQAVEAIQEHLHRGDAYELNFCREFFATGVDVDPLPLFLRLNALSPAPFAAYYRLDDIYLLCSSPERFLKKKGSRLLSQPIKGTSRRGNTPEEDERLRQQLYNSAKERAENVMTVDLVRNDLSRTAEAGSVQVEELFGIYTFAQVHQMISTVTARLGAEYDAVDALRAAFPMGSMTGAPKRRVMELIARYERSRRGLFSGSVGYFTPDGDFDFNVVIRSLLYNASTRYLSFQTGSAITLSSDPEKELEECLLKAEAIRKAFCPA